MLMVKRVETRWACILGEGRVDQKTRATIEVHHFFFLIPSLNLGA